MRKVTAALATLVLAGSIKAQQLSISNPHPVAQSFKADSLEYERALHLLNRITFGPRPGEVERVAAMGVEEFLERQLNPESIDDSEVQRTLEQYEILRLSTQQLAQIFQRERRAQRQRQLAMRAESAASRDVNIMMDRRARRREGYRGFRRLMGEFQQVAAVRAALSERQLYEVMVDFWTNHFNVFMAKGPNRYYTPSYIEETIRPHALGRFEDLLIATAKSPAMLFYLDNAQSVAAGSEPPNVTRLRARRSRIRHVRNRERADSMLARFERRRPKGINENYAREVLELHTLGVDGGYSQQDVMEVARILTGWSIDRLGRGGGFVFNEWAHDRGEKTVLGRRFPDGRGIEEGIQLLEILASHPSTMYHVSSKLCARFVNDEPPSGCTDAAVHAWQKSDGEIREVLRGILTSPEFWAPENRFAKIKTPFEFVISAVRAIGAEPDSTPTLARIIARLGQPLYLQQVPTGYPETQESWVNSGALLDRVNIALGIAGGRLPGVSVDLDRVAPANLDLDRMITAVNQGVLNNTATENTLRVMREQAGDIERPEGARALLIGLALGSPEFQRQ